MKEEKKNSKIYGRFFFVHLNACAIHLFQIFNRKCHERQQKKKKPERNR